MNTFIQSCKSCEQMDFPQNTVENRIYISDKTVKKFLSHGPLTKDRNSLMPQPCVKPVSATIRTDSARSYSESCQAIADPV